MYYYNIAAPWSALDENSVSPCHLESSSICRPKVPYLTLTLLISMRKKAFDVKLLEPWKQCKWRRVNWRNIASCGLNPCFLAGDRCGHLFNGSLDFYSVCEIL